MDCIGYPDKAHPAVKRGALRLSEHLGLPVKKTPDASYITAECGQLGCELPKRTFRIFRKGGQVVFTGDRPRSVLAGLLYYLHHLRRGRELALPMERTSPYPHRLVMEDYPFMCYWPTGFEFDLNSYTENLVGLGFTAMECNRFSRTQPMEPYHWNYAFSNPSICYFVWTEWHEGVWEKELIEANAAELDRTIGAALEYDLEPTLTSFLPRPYPEAFFAKHPHLRGPRYQLDYMVEAGHDAEFCLDTDNQEVMDFYGELYAGLFDRYPQIGNLFFWHSDLGTTFWPDGQGSTGRSRVERIGEFQRMISDLLTARNMHTRVWVNPWQLPEECLNHLNKALPRQTGFSVKDNSGGEIVSAGSTIELGDATVITAELGDLPKSILKLAAPENRQVCLGQYQDFSEDLDPIVGLCHPIMTFCKCRVLKETGRGYSALHWGVISPDVVGENPNQDVIREMSWGYEAKEFTDLERSLMPTALRGEQVKAVGRAWRLVDEALRAWPQFWGLRLQDSGLRLRWLIRPFGFYKERITEEEASYYLDHQIYRLNRDTPFKAFMDINAEQAGRVAETYADMVERLIEAEKCFEAVLDAHDSEEVRGWLGSQLAAVRTLRYFWTTYRNLLAFESYRAIRGVNSESKRYLMDLMRAEIDNVEKIRAHLRKFPNTVITAERPWGQCFGRNVCEDFERKIYLMRRDLHWAVDD